MNKKIKKILKVLYALKDGDEFYFKSYGADLMADLIKEDKETLQILRNFIRSEHLSSEWDKFYKKAKAIRDSKE